MLNVRISSIGRDLLATGAAAEVFAFLSTHTRPIDERAVPLGRLWLDARRIEPGLLKYSRCSCSARFPRHRLSSP